MREGYRCENCGQEVPALLFFDGQELCVDCLDERTCLCHRCGERLLLGDNAGNDALPLCQSCFDYHYTRCHHCGRLLLIDDAYSLEENGDDLCGECHHELSLQQSIRDYYFKPAPIFYGEGPRYFGVELEIDGAGESASNAQELLEIVNANQQLIYCKHDGSLDDGFEIVTYPLSLTYHQTEMPWREVLRKAVELGYRSHQTKTCGLHVHVSRTAFGPSESEQDAAIARVLYFFEKHWEELLKFSRRTQRQLDQWATRYGYKDHPMEILDQAKKGYGGGRYSSINLQNWNTIEFRIFRGTLKFNTLIATLQLVNRVCDVALFMSDQEVKDLSWTTFVAGCQEPELVQYLKERRLYVNEPVESEGEV